MADTGTIPAWIALFTGVYALAASLGELANPGMWTKMIREMSLSHGLRFLTGIFLIALGAAIYLVNPWVPGDWLAVAVTVMGALCILEGVAFLIFGKQFMDLSHRALSGNITLWAGLSALMGVALIIVGYVRLT